MINKDIEQIDIDNRENNYPNKGIFLTLKYYIETKEVIYNDSGVEFDNLDRLRYVCVIISYITDEKLLNHTAAYLKHCGLLKNVDAKFEEFKNNSISSYSDTDLIKIKAILYSLTSRYEVLMKTINPPNSGEPLFDITIKDRIIKHNLPAVINSLERKGTLSFVNSIEMLPLKEQKDAISIWITNCLKLDYSNNTNTFTDSINFLNILKENLVQDKIDILKPKHEPIFSNNGFELFEDILSEYVKPIGKKGRLSEIHYYYRKMYEDDFIHQRPERFKTWFFETYKKEDLGKIKTLKEVENLDRKIHYATALEWFKQQHR
ncbi:hypothetical protein [Flavobacterium gawalongense]|uniref:Uncharacterized protein n=1 Tax=Flavobacterium gawalongense TaxID=2594432 RepID=A0A553BDQ6_9FLAO|nr:hypothetical protein [Flavobacterium gawalongense]TRX06383.1 hypothetical protein FNW11_14520 [Flavobacterium gawalongense]TRX12748.1 hypothetical protein FNW10_04160 [Flavobacterium gawalongense]TRX30463.1 hypothetical protein FNW38_03585 [Flavobacterium gawalongense]